MKKTSHASFLVCGPAVWAARRRWPRRPTKATRRTEGRESVAKGLDESGPRRAAKAARHRGRDGSEARRRRGRRRHRHRIHAALPEPCGGRHGPRIGEDIQTDFLDKAKMKVQLQPAEQRAVRSGDGSRSEVAGRYAGRRAGAGRVSSLRLSGGDAGAYSRQLAVGRQAGDCRIFQAARARCMGGTDRALEHIRLDQDDLIKEVEANGFRLVSKRDLVPKSQYIAVFAKK